MKKLIMLVVMSLFSSALFADGEFCCYWFDRCTDHIRCSIMKELRAVAEEDGIGRNECVSCNVPEDSLAEENGVYSGKAFVFYIKDGKFFRLNYNVSYFSFGGIRTVTYEYVDEESAGIPEDDDGPVYWMMWDYYHGN